LATISARIASTAPSRPFGAPDARPDCAARAALTASSGPGLAVAVPVLPVGPAGLHYPDPVPGEVTGQAGPVAAGALDADQGDVPELPEPAQQAGVPGRGRGELPRPEQPAEGVEGRGDVHLGMGVDPAGNGASFFYDGHCRPFLG
jgi:hypothetical protein